MKAVLASTVFNPSVGTGLGSRATLPATGFSKRVAYYTTRSDMAEDDRVLYCVYLMFCGTSTETNIEKWKTWMLSLVAAVTPPLAETFPASSHLKQPLSAVSLQSIKELLHDLESACESGSAERVKNACTAIATSSAGELLPRPGANIDFGTSWGEWTSKIIMCFYSIALFLAGKRINGADHSAATVARPRALKQKVHIDAVVSLLEGECRMSDVAHVMINNAWSELGAARAIVFTEYAKYGSVEADEMQNIIWTTMHLLRFSNMAHSVIVYDFLQSYPWVFDIPLLRPSLTIYIRSVLEAGKIDRAHLPYLKLIYGDKANIFPRKEMEPLIACAVHALSETKATLAAFYTDPAYAPIIDIFDKMRVVKEVSMAQISDRALKGQVDLVQLGGESDDSGSTDDETEKE